MTMVLAAEAADLDVVWGLKGSIAGLQHHRGITHSFVGVPFIAAATVGVVYLWSRTRDHLPSRKKKLAREASAGIIPPRPPLPIRWGYLYFIAVVAALSHLLLDYTTAYGIRLFEPFNYRWYSWDIMFIIDPLMLLVLIAGLTVPALFGLVNQEIGVRQKGPRGQGGAIFALLCVVMLYGVRDYQHRRAVNALEALTYRGAVPTRVAAYPYWVNPFQWHGVVETGDFLETVPVNSLGPEVGPSSDELVYFKPEETPASVAAKSSYLGRVYLDWAVFPYVQVQKLEGEVPGYLAGFKDLRYAYPDARGSAPLQGYVLLSPDLHVEEQGMNSSKSPTVENLERGENPR